MFRKLGREKYLIKPQINLEELPEFIAAKKAFIDAKRNLRAVIRSHGSNKRAGTHPRCGFGTLGSEAARKAANKRWQKDLKGFSSM